MKILIALLMMSFVASSYARRSCSLLKSKKPFCYHPRPNAVFNVALLYYGDHMEERELDDIEELLIERFSKATAGMMKLRVLDKRKFSYLQRMPRDFTYNNITDPERLQRIFYKEILGGKVINEIYDLYKARTSAGGVDMLDAILAVTGAQFEGLGFAHGRVSVIEHPQEIAWNLPNGGRVKYLTKYEIVDELLHELGHNMFIGHAASQCQQPGMTPAERRACCAESPNRNDVMSSCRDRDSVSEDKMFGFEQCHLERIRDLIIPSMLRGGKWNVDNSKRCR